MAKAKTRKPDSDGAKLEPEDTKKCHEPTPRPPVRVLICGSRTWTDEDLILAQIFLLPDQSIIIHGAHPDGADAIARKWADVLMYEQDPYPADWPRYGNQAGPIRNTRMLKEGKPDLVWAFTHELTGGTADMVSKARRAKVEVHVFGCQELTQLSLFSFDQALNTTGNRRAQVRSINL